MGVEMLGFRVIPGADNYIPPNVFQDIRGWVAGPAIVAELYGISDARQIGEVITKYAPDYFELSLDEYLIYHQLLALPCIVYFPDTSQVAAVRGDEKISHALVDDGWSCKDVEHFSVPVLVKITSVGLVQEKLSAACFKGVVLEGPKEQRPGVTNYEQLGGILESLEEE